MEPSKNDPTMARPDLTTIVGDVLGDLAFLVSDDEQSEASPGTVWMECHVSYSGPPGGTLCCWCTREFAVQLAANLLGLNPENEAVLSGVDDALREFMNVVCGQFITACHGTDRIFNLSIPTASQCAQAPRFDFDGSETACALTVSGEPFYCKYERERG